MKNLTSEEIVILGSSIAIELARGKTKEEVYLVKTLLLQIVSSLATLCYK